MGASFFYIRRFFYQTYHLSAHHKHPFFEFKYYLRGSGTTTLGGREYPFETNQIVLIPPQLPHDESYTNSPGELFCMTFYAEHCPFLRLIPPKTLRPNSLLLNYFQMIYRETIEQKPHYEEVIDSYMKLLLIELERLLSTQKNVRDNLIDIRNYINEHYFERIEFPQLATRCGYSYDYFRHLFKSKFELSPQNYQIKLRLDAAKQMLVASPDIRITEVAETCGFSDSAQLSTMFSSQFGISPKQFQKKAARERDGAQLAENNK